MAFFGLKAHLVHFAFIAHVGVLGTIMKQMKRRWLKSKRGEFKEEKLVSGTQTWVHKTKGGCCKDTLFRSAPDLLNQNCLGQGDGA